MTAPNEKVQQSQQFSCFQISLSALALLMIFSEFDDNRIQKKEKKKIHACRFQYGAYIWIEEYWALTPDHWWHFCVLYNILWSVMVLLVSVPVRLLLWWCVQCALAIFKTFHIDCQKCHAIWHIYYTDPCKRKASCIPSIIDGKKKMKNVNI